MKKQENCETKKILDLREKHFFDNLMQKNYDSIVKRGLITETTTVYDFYDKFAEESIELYFELQNKMEQKKSNFKTTKDLEFELADNILVLLNFAKHMNIDILQVMKEKIEINFKR